MIHGDDPSNSKDPHGERPEGQPAPEHQQPVIVEHVPLSELSPPPRGAIGSRLKKLFNSPTPDAIAELDQILWTSDQASVLSYFGYRLAQVLSPETAALACEALRRKSIPCTQDLLVGLAQREYCKLMLRERPLLEGSEYSELRKLIASIAVSPECHFIEKDWQEKRRDILTLTTYPITILRGCADRGVDEILLQAATHGGLDPSMNRRALEMLRLRESSDPVKRVLPGFAISEIARETDSYLRDPFNKSQLYGLVDQWTSKQENLPSAGECSIRDQLLYRWKEFQDSAQEIPAEENPEIIEVLRILRHFPDPVSALALKEAAEHPHAGIRIIAKLSLEGQSERAFADLRTCLRKDAHPFDTLAALRVFGYHISPSTDRLLGPVLEEFVQFAWSREAHEKDGNPFLVAQKIVLLQGVLRRFYSEPLDSPFLKPIFDCVGGPNQPMSNVGINTFVQAVEIGILPPPHFYDNAVALTSLRTTLEILSQSANKNEGTDSRALLEAVEELFVMRGPAAYGFELVAE